MRLSRLMRRSLVTSSGGMVVASQIADRQLVAVTRECAEHRESCDQIQDYYRLLAGYAGRVTQRAFLLATEPTLRRVCTRTDCSTFWYLDDPHALKDIAQTDLNAPVLGFDRALV